MELPKIDPQIEKETEAMFSLAQQIKKLKAEYPSCWSIIKQQFHLGDYRPDDFIEHSAETVKVDLYVEIMKANELKRLKKEKAIAKKS